MSLCRVSTGSKSIAVRFILSVVLTSWGLTASAQQAQYAAFTNVDSAEVWFDQIVSPVNASIVNGPEYRVTFQGFNSHPFFLSSESDRTYIRYNEDLFRNIDLLYDSYGDILVHKFVTANKVLFIKLDNKLVQDFSLHNHYFKKYDEGIRAGIGAYFDVLFEGTDFAVLVKRRKVERLEGNRSDYIEDDVYYILDSGKWIRITGNGSFSKTLDKSKRKDLAAFAKSNHINARKRKDDDLKKLGAFCYSLKTSK
jgi:hypothetical protein